MSDTPSAPDQTGRRSLEITIDPCWRDHRFKGQAVLPAVAAMALLAGEVRRYFTAHPLSALISATFDKFLPLPPQAGTIRAQCEILSSADGSLIAALATRNPVGKSSMVRVKTHARITFAAQQQAPAPRPVDIAAALEGQAWEISPREIYREWVPFGPAYRNIVAPLRLSADGALAMIQAPAHPPLPPLGSPYPLDAALHAACCWGRHFTGITAFPVGFAARHILRPTHPRETYWGRVYPLEQKGEVLAFDIELYDEQGRLCEALQKVAMRRVGSAPEITAQSPASPASDLPLKNIRSRCDQLVLMELDSMAPFAPRALSPEENRRFQQMGKRRQRSYVGARLACKRLARRLSPGNDTRGARAIHTVHGDGLRPVCPPARDRSALDCAVAHDGRYVVAVAAPNRCGIDVEPLGLRALKSARLYMSSRERALVDANNTDSAATALRIWSVKEAVAKALNINLAQAWSGVELQSATPQASQFRLDDGAEHTARHDTLEGHLFTLVEI